MFNRSEIKYLARETIRDKISILFLCVLIYSGIILFCGLIPVAGSLLTLLIEPILSFGMILIYMDTANGINVYIPTLFKGFKENYKTIWLTYFLMELFSFLWSLLFVIPGIVKAISYSMAPYILAENPTFTAREAINESIRITNGYKMDLFLLSLSFIGWIFLGTLTLGIAFVYIVPYMQASYASAYYTLKNNCDSYYQGMC